MSLPSLGLGVFSGSDAASESEIPFASIDFSQSGFSMSLISLSAGLRLNSFSLFSLLQVATWA
jgi:hypothetical protein